MLDINDKRFKVLMEIAYAALIEEMHVRTERILRYHYAPRRIHKSTVPPDLFARPIILPSQSYLRRMDFKTWFRREKLLDIEYEQDVKRMEDLIPIAEMLEVWFEAKKKQEMEKAWTFKAKEQNTGPPLLGTISKKKPKKIGRKVKI